VRVTVAQAASNFWRAIAHYGFMDGRIFPACWGNWRSAAAPSISPTVTHFVGHETVTRRQDGKGLLSWQEALFAVMKRNAAHVTDFFNLPSEQVVGIRRQISI
jgi:KUP system potassium uptake protein